jgi:hypothetical protein
MYERAGLNASSIVASALAALGRDDTLTLGERA